MHSDKFRINTNGQSLRNPTNGFFGMTLSANNLNSDESDLAANNDRRSAHNALERQRREHLNNKFQQLAHVLPSLQSIRRPSKTLIVAKSLEFVTSSLKRETTFTSEIQKLKEENAKLKLQAELANNRIKSQLKKQASKQEDKDYEEPEPKASLKRKASSSAQLSPPPTPEAISKNNVTMKKQAIVVGTPVHPKKKRMVKQTKSTVDTLSLSPWSPIDNVNGPQSQHNPTITSCASTTSHTITSAPTSSASDAPCFVMTSPYASNNNNLLFVTPATTAPVETLSYLQQDNSFMPEMNPMLLAPYYIPSESDFPFTPFSNQASSNDPPFYL